MMGLCSVVSAQGHADFWDLPPIRYSDTAPSDRIAALARDLVEGKVQPDDRTPLGKLRFVLEYLDVPEESQVLVFSKTSLQNKFIQPNNPRSIYFSENAYVGHVPGGSIEVIVHDAVLGPVFYLVEQETDGTMRIARDTSQCMSCHATARTENVPGMLIRSVYPGEDGHPLLHLGTNDVSHETPLEQRWGGWYVTGRSSIPHLGNRTFDDDGDLEPANDSLRTVPSLVDVSGYLRPTSDIVSLMVLEHQVKMHTLLNAASLNYRRSVHFLKALDPEADPDSGSTGRMAESWAENIVEYIFFKDEADLGEGVEGDRAFQNAFVKRFPRSSEGNSLAEFRLYGRIFKNRCSYMVYSDAFKGLPLALKQKVIERMKLVVSGEAEGFEWLKSSELRRIDEILKETLPGWE